MINFQIIKLLYYPLLNVIPTFIVFNINGGLQFLT